MRLKVFLFLLTGFVSGFAEGKVYVSADQIMVMQEGIFLQTANGGSISLHSLSYDEGGLYVQTDAADQTFQCPGCQTQYADNGKPIYCQRRTCPLYGKRIK